MRSNLVMPKDTHTGFSPVLTDALDLADRGTPVFPCGRDKKPRTPNGFRDATTDPIQVMLWFESDPNLLIGVPTGEVSGFDVFDIDVYKPEGAAFYEANKDRLPETRVHRT